jgi:hypothetical protein
MVDTINVVEMTPTDQLAIAQTNVAHALVESDILAAMMAASVAGDMVEVARLATKLAAATKPIAQAVKSAEQEQIAATRVERQGLENTLATLLGNSDTVKAIKSAVADSTLSVRAVRSSEVGTFDDLTIKIVLSTSGQDALSELVHRLILESNADAVKSATRINIDGISVSVESGQSASSGWKNAKTGIVAKLSEIWEVNATPDQKLEYSALKNTENSNNTQNALRRKVAIDSGWVINKL